MGHAGAKAVVVISECELRASTVVEPHICHLARRDSQFNHESAHLKRSLGSHHLTVILLSSRPIIIGRVSQDSSSVRSGRNRVIVSPTCLTQE